MISSIPGASTSIVATVPPSAGAAFSRDFFGGRAAAHSARHSGTALGPGPEPMNTDLERKAPIGAGLAKAAHGLRPPPGLTDIVTCRCIPSSLIRTATLKLP